MDKNLKYIVLVGVAGVGVYIIWKGGYFQQWFPSLFGADLKNPTLCQTATIAQLAAAQIGDFASLLQELPAKASDVYTWTGKTWSPPGFAGTCGATAPTTPPAITAPNTPPPPAVSTAPAIGTIFTDGAGNQQKWTGSGWQLISCAGGKVVSGNSCAPPGAAATSCDSGQIMANGQCVSPNAGGGAPALPPSQQMLAAAQASGAGDVLSTDQWCEIYQTLTSSNCPIDPGTIDPSLYSAATGITDADRSTPINVTQWLAMMQTAMPGLSGMGAAWGLGYLT